MVGTQVPRHFLANGASLWSSSWKPMVNVFSLSDWLACSRAVTAVLSYPRWGTHLPEHQPPCGNGRRIWAIFPFLQWPLFPWYRSWAGCMHHTSQYLCKLKSRRCVSKRGNVLEQFMRVFKMHCGASIYPYWRNCFNAGWLIFLTKPGCWWKLFNSESEEEQVVMPVIIKRLYPARSRKQYSLPLLHRRG